MMQNIKAILFDLDNTLIDRQAAADKKYRAVAKELFPSISPETYEMENVVQQLISWDEFGSISKEHVYSELVKKYNMDISLVDKYCEDWGATFGDYTIVYPRARETVEKVKQKYRVGIVTNGTSHMQHRKLEISGLADLFEMILISGECSAHKPDPEIFLEASEKMGLKPEEIAFVGDTFATDIIGAYRVGMKPIWICSDPLRTYGLHEPRIERIEDLITLLDLK